MAYQHILHSRNGWKGYMNFLGLVDVSHLKIKQFYRKRSCRWFWGLTHLCISQLVSSSVLRKLIWQLRGRNWNCYTGQPWDTYKLVFSREDSSMKTLNQTTLTFPESQENGPWVTPNIVNQAKGWFFEEKAPKFAYAKFCGKGSVTDFGWKILGGIIKFVGL